MVSLLPETLVPLPIAMYMAAVAATMAPMFKTALD